MMNLRDAYIAGYTAGAAACCGNQGWRPAPAEVTEWETKAMGPADAGPEPDPPAPGWIVTRATSHYYGSHPERGEGDEYWWVALATEDTRPPVLIHGTRNHQYRGDSSQMHLVRIWDGEEWVTPQKWESA